jgi:hypothetical protein
MSITTVKTGGQTITSIDTAQVALGNNEFTSAVYTNGTGSTVTLAEGTVFGRISATGKVAILAHGASDGSKYPTGVFYNGINGNIEVADGASATITLITKGSVNASKLVFDGSTTVDSVVTDIQLRDRLTQIGLQLDTPLELTNYDN